MSRAPQAALVAAWVVALMMIYGWFVPEPGPNELSHVDLAHALVHQRSSING